MDPRPGHAPRAERRRLSHVDRSGRPRMVDVSDKPVTARRAVADWIEDYNSQRRHSTDNMLSPIDYEHTCAQRRSEDDGHDPRAA